MCIELPVESLKKAICYFYLLAFCPPENIAQQKKALKSLHKGASRLSGLKDKEFIRLAALEASRHIMAFHQNTREPGTDWVEALADRAMVADTNPEQAAAFQELMTLVSRLPQRAKPENRLHRRRGCQFCTSPCAYGYFSLVSEPEISILQGFLEHEIQESPDTQKPIMAVSSFALTHITLLVGDMKDELSISQDHLSGLAYCLLSLATARSRLQVPEQQLGLFQEANQYLNITNLPAESEA